MFDMGPSMIFLFALVLIVLSPVLYLAPWLSARHRKHHNTKAILLLNLLLGWTVVGWIAAAVWSFTDPAPRGESVGRACLKCGRGYDLDAKFCPSCGAPAPRPEELVAP